MRGVPAWSQRRPPIRAAARMPQDAPGRRRSSRRDQSRLAGLSVFPVEVLRHFPLIHPAPGRRGVSFHHSDDDGLEIWSSASRRRQVSPDDLAALVDWLCDCVTDQALVSMSPEKLGTLALSLDLVNERLEARIAHLMAPHLARLST